MESRVRRWSCDLVNIFEADREPTKNTARQAVRQAIIKENRTIVVLVSFVA